MLLRPLGPFLIFFAAVTGCSTTQSPASIAPEAPPLPKSLHGKLVEYYPDGSKRAHEQGRVVVIAEIGPSGVLEQAVSFDRTQTDATPRLEEAAAKVLRGNKFEVGNRYKKRVTVSIVFELVPCGAITQASSVDYRINICLDPSPYADVNFAEHPPSELESQINKILLHGDLADTDFLEETLGVRFRVTPPARSPYSLGRKLDPNLHVLVTPTLVPNTFRVQGFAYESRADTKARTSTFRLSFRPVGCPDIGIWAARLNLKTTLGSDPHGYGTGVEFQSAGEHGISVSAFYHAGGGCSMLLSQRKEMGEPFSSRTDRDLISPIPLVRGLGAMIASGDIRNVAFAERALGASFTTSEPIAFGVNYELKSVIPGIDPGYFEYSVNDTGEEPSPFGAFTSVPPIPANRTADLRLIVDVYHLCIRPRQLPAELHRRGVHFRHIVKDGEGNYVIRGKNQIRVRLGLFGGCIGNIAISQTTDVKHAIAPISDAPPQQPTVE